jgi:hypothetical protein
MTRKKKSSTAITVGPRNSETVKVSPNNQTVTVVSSKRKQPKRQGRKSRNLSFRNQFGRERSFFITALLAPGAIGPFRQPRSSGSTRTGLGYDVTEYIATGSGTNLVQGCIGTTTYQSYCGYAYALATTGTALGSGAVINVISQFPPSAAIADVNITGLEILAYYTGNPLNVQGEVIMGSSITPSTTATYSSLFYFPGTIKFPVAELIRCPKRVSFRKISPVADEFVPISTANADCDVPYMFTSGLPVGGTINFIISRTFEYRSTTVSPNVVPFEGVGPDYMSDIAAFTNARADVAGLYSTVTDAPNDQYGALGTMLGLGVGGMGAATMMMRNFHSRSQSQRSADPDQMISLQEHMAQRMHGSRNGGYAYNV